MLLRLFPRRATHHLATRIAQQRPFAASTKHSKLTLFPRRTTHLLATRSVLHAQQQMRQNRTFAASSTQHSKVALEIQPTHTNTYSSTMSPMFSQKSFQTAAVSAVASSFLWGPGAFLTSGGLAFNPLFGIGITGLIAVHEAGHVLACKYYRIPSEAPVFVGVGAYVKHNIPSNAHKEALIALAGPVIGSAGALSCTGLGFYLDNAVIFYVGQLGLIINLLNLLPFRPLDGGSIIRALSPTITAGFAAAGCAGAGYLALSGYTASEGTLYTMLLYAELSGIVGLASYGVYNTFQNTGDRSQKESRTFCSVYCDNSSYYHCVWIRTYKK